MADRPDYVTDVKVFSKNQGKRLAAGAFTVCEAISVNFTIFEGVNGPRLVLPQVPNPNFDSSKEIGKGNSKYYEEVRFISGPARKALEDYLFEHVNSSDSDAGSRRTTSSNTKDDFPF